MGQSDALILDPAFLVTRPHRRYDVTCPFKSPFGVTGHRNLDRRLAAARDFLTDPAEQFQLRFVDVLQADFRQPASLCTPAAPIL